MRARVAVTTALLALAAAPSAHAGQKPNGRELWRAYPLAPSPTAAASRTPTGGAAPAATRRPAATPAPANDGGGGGWAPIALAVLAATAGAAGVATFRRRGRAAPAPASPAAAGAGAPAPAPVAAVPQAGASEAPAPAPVAAVPRAGASEAPAPPPVAPARTGRFKPRAAAELRRRFKPSPRPPADPPARRFEPSSPAPARATRTAERLRAAVDMQLGREWPWPESSDGLWRCEIGPDQAALSARFRAVVHAPDGDPPRVLAVSAPGPSGGDWQSAEPLERAVNGLAAQLVADGWEPVEGTGDPYTRRFCWRRDDAPHFHLEETAWSA